MAATPHHTYWLLTKRPPRARKLAKLSTGRTTPGWASRSRIRRFITGWTTCATHLPPSRCCSASHCGPLDGLDLRRDRMGHGGWRSRAKIQGTRPHGGQPSAGRERGRWHVLSSCRPESAAGSRTGLLQCRSSVPVKLFTRRTSCRVAPLSSRKLTEFADVHVRVSSHAPPSGPPEPQQAARRSLPGVIQVLVADHAQDGVAARGPAVRPQQDRLPIRRQLDRTG